MRTIERVMRVMTHVNIGATLGMAAWLLWSGLLVASGQWKILKADAAATRVHTPPGRQAVALPCCFVPAAEWPADPRSLQARSRSAELLARAEPGGAP